MQSDNPILDGLARLMTDAAGAAQSVRTEMDTFMRQRLERLVADIVDRQRRLAGEERRGPQRFVADKSHDIPPAQEQAGDVRECVPAYAELPPDMDQYRIEIREGDGGFEHAGMGSRKRA